MEDKKILSFEDLEAVAGGATLDEKMTAEEKAHMEKLKLRFKDATVDYVNGKISKAEYDAAKNELVHYTDEMRNKYK